MAQELGTGYIIISPTAKGLGKAIEGSISAGTAAGTQKSGKSIISTIGGAFGKIGKVGVGTIAGIASGIAGLTAKGGFDRALNIERAQTKLKALKYDTASVDKIMGNALASVKGTAFGLGDAASVAATLVASGIKQGGDLEGVLTTVGDAAQISGRSFQDMGLIFSQVAAKGKLQGDDMLQLMGSGIPVLQYLADHFHTTTEAASDMVSDGKVSFADFEAAMKEHIGGAAKNAGESFDGMVGNVKAAIGRLGEQFETPLLNAATKVGGKLIPIIDQTTTATGKLADQFAGRLDIAASIAAQKIEDLGNSIASGKTSIADLAAQAATLAGGFATLATVGGNADKIVSVLDQLGKSGDKGIADLIANLKKGGSGIGGAFDAIKTKIANAKGYLNPSLRDAMAIDGNPFANAINRIRQGGSQLTSATDGIFDAIRTKLTPGMANLAFKWENSGLYTGLTATATGIKTKTGQICDAITKGLATAAGKINTSPLGSAITAIGNKTKPLFNKTIREAMTLDGDPFASALSKISGKISSLAAPFKTAFGNIFGGLGDAIGGPLQNAIGSAGGKLQSGLDTIGNLVTRFFAPGNFIKFLGIGALAAALVAGIGMINSQMGGQLSRVINSAFASLPDILSKAETWIQSSLPQFISSGTYIIEMVLQGITTALPSLVSVGTLLIDTIVTSLASHLPVLMPMAVTLVTTLVTSLIAAAPQLMSAGLTLLDGLLQGIVASLPTLAAAIPQIITAIITALATGLPQLMEQGVQMVMNLVNGLVSAMPQLAAQVPKIISTLINGLCANLPNILSTGMQMLATLVTGLAQALPQLVAYVPQIIAGIVNTIASHLPKILSTGVQMLVALASGFVSAIPQLVGRIPAIISSIRNAFTGVNWGGVGMNIIRGIAGGVASAAGELVNAAVSAARNALDWVKSKLGIHSPSRVFRDQVGVMIGRGAAIGVERSAPALKNAADAMVSDAIPQTIPLPTISTDALKDSLRKATASITAGDMRFSAQSTAIPAASTATTYNITLNNRAIEGNERLQRLLAELVSACGATVTARS